MISRRKVFALLGLAVPAGAAAVKAAELMLTREAYAEAAIKAANPLYFMGASGFYVMDTHGVRRIDT